MKQITPYKNFKEAVEELDNGGRFYNLLTKAKDGNITSSELSKAVGVFSTKQSNILFLEMNLLALNETDTHKVLSTLDTDLFALYKKHKPSYFSPEQAILKGEVSKNAIVTGIPKYVKTNSDFTGFIFIPIMTGKVTTMMLVPIIDHYDVYEIKDTETSEKILIAHARNKEKLPEQKIRCGGIFKELKNNKTKKEVSTKFLETIYYNIV